MGVGNNIKDKGQRKVTFRLKPECWEGVSHTNKTWRKKEDHSHKENSKCKGPGVRMSWLCSFWNRKMVAKIQWVQNVVGRWGQRPAEAKSHTTMNSMETFLLLVNKYILYTYCVRALPWTLYIRFLFWSSHETYEVNLVFSKQMRKLALRPV